jgi:hypothetical protein
LKKFLESTPPNVGAKIENLFGEYHPQARNTTWSVRAIPIEVFCETCGGPRFFEPKTDYLFAGSGYGWAFVHYSCKSCEYVSKTFAVVVEQDQKSPANGEIMKLGEPTFEPSWRRCSKTSLMC